MACARRVCGHHATPSLNAFPIRGFNLERVWDEEWEKTGGHRAGSGQNRVSATLYQMFDLYVVKQWPRAMWPKTARECWPRVCRQTSRLSPGAKRNSRTQATACLEDPPTSGQLPPLVLRGTGLVSNRCASMKWRRASFVRRRAQPGQRIAAAWHPSPAKSWPAAKCPSGTDRCDAAVQWCAGQTSTIPWLGISRLPSDDVRRLPFDRT